MKYDNNPNILQSIKPKSGAGEWIIPGATLLPDVAELLTIEFQPRGRYKTIAGFLMTELGYVPNEGDQLRRLGYTFTVKTRHYLRIVDVHIVRDLQRWADDR